MKVGSISFYCADVLVLAILVWRRLILKFMHLILLLMVEFSPFLIMVFLKLIPFHLICKVLGVTLLARGLRLKILVVLSFVLLGDFHSGRIYDNCKWIHD